MAEVAAVYRSLEPGSIALICSFIGLIGGSFSTVLTHGHRQSGALQGPRSQCPQCRHVLGPLDLVPIFSFVAQLGRCRYCRHRISWRYPLLEVGSGVTAGLSGYLWGWTGGLGGAIAWCVFAWGLSRVSGWRRSLFRSQQGTTLVEVLVASALIAVALVPFLDSLSVSGNAAWAAQRRTLVLGLARARLSEVDSAAYAAWLGGGDLTSIDGMTGSNNNVINTGNGTTDTYQITTDVLPYPAAAPNPNLREVRVTVSCPTCTGRFGLPVKPVTVSTVVRGG